MKGELYALIPVSILLVVALHQRIRVCWVGQTAWKGGGFGMFSEINRHSVVATLHVDQADGAVLTRLSPRHRWDAGAAPTEGNLQRWGREILAVKWRQGRDGAEIADPDWVGDELPVLSVSIQHFELDFDAACGRYEAVMQREVSVASSREGVAKRCKT